MSDSGDSDTENSDSEALNFPPKNMKYGQDIESDEHTGPKVAPKLADIVNKRWGSKLKEAKLK